MKAAFERGILSAYDFRKKSVVFAYGASVLLVALMVLSMLYPFAVTMMNAFKPNEQIFEFPPRFFPKEWKWANLKTGWNYINLVLYLKNTIMLFIGNMICIFLATGLAAYALSCMRLPYRRAIYAFFMATLFIPPSTYIIPNFINLKDLGLVNTFWAFWLPAGANAFYLLVLKSFFDGIHPELLEAARIDGASEWLCFRKIAVPLSLPIFSTIAIFVFAAVWNDWFWPSLVLHDPNKMPLATAVYKYVINARRLDWNIRFAILFMVMTPPVLVFLLFQKYMLRGISLAGIKG